MTQMTDQFQELLGAKDRPDGHWNLNELKLMNTKQRSLDKCKIFQRDFLETDISFQEIIVG